MKLVFISKDPQELHSALHQLWAEGVLTAQSLLSYSAVSFTCQPTFDLVFFASIRAAEFYLAQCAPPAIFGVAGSETALKIEQIFGLKAAFVAQNSGNPAQEAEVFNQWRANRSVLFPSSNLSLGTYAKLIPELPRLVHDFLKHRQTNNSAQLQQLIEEQRRTNRMLQRLMWVGGGFLAGLVAMQMFVRLHHYF